jgi:subtilase family serine protease
MRVPLLAAGLLAAAPLVVATAAPAGASFAHQDLGTVTAGSEILDLTLTLRGPHESDRRRYAADVSTPGVATYQHFLTVSELRQRFGASTAAIDRVTDWARAAGFQVGSVDSTGTRLPLTGTAGTVKRAFGVTLYDGTQGGVHVHAATAVRLPSRIAAAVSAVSGLNRQPAATMHLQRATARQKVFGSTSVQLDGGLRGSESNGLLPGSAGVCATAWAHPDVAPVPSRLAGRTSAALCGYTGPQLRALYGLEASDDGVGQTIVIAGAFNQPSTLQDANTAFAATGVAPLPSGRYQVKTYAEGTSRAAGCDTSGWGLEQALDVQVAHTLAPAARIVYAAAPDCTRLTDTLAKVIADPGLHGSVVSNSWGYPAGALSNDELAATDAVLTRASVLGTGTYTASGLYGSATGTGMLLPDRAYPSSPRTTAVGGTTSAIGTDLRVLWQTGWASTATALYSDAATDSTSRLATADAGGGRSLREARPAWQPAGGNGMRQVPDLAALADPDAGLLVGTTSHGRYSIDPVGGTSLATPIVASLVALGQARTGHRSGLISPLLWHNTAADATTLTDVRHINAAVWTPQLRDAAPNPAG